MTRCIGSPAQEMAEQYLSGELQGPEAEQFENHFFGCEPCHEQLRALMDVREALAAKPAAVPVAAPATRPVPRQGFRQRILAFPVPLAVLGSLAAMLLVVAVLVQVRRPTPISPQNGSVNTAAKTQPAVPNPKDNQDRQAAALQPSKTPMKGAGTPAATAQDAPQTTELASLADVQLPGYSAPQLRDGEPADADHDEFSAGMQAYAQGDCGRALDALTKVAASAKDAIAAKLYSGLCELKGRQLDRAEASFAAVYAAGDTPALETAEYFMAQAMLLRGDAAGAKSWLNRTVALHGDYEDRAQKQVAALAK